MSRCAFILLCSGLACVPCARADDPPFFQVIPRLDGVVGAGVNALSGDGRVVLGTASYFPGGSRAFLWTRENGYAVLGSIPDGWGQVRASDISRDGSVFVGQADTDAGQIAYRFELGVGFESIDNGRGFSQATGVSGDGQAVSGFGDVDDGPAFRWTRPEGLAGLGLPDGASSALASKISADGGAVVGIAYDPAGERAMRWTDESGMQFLPPLHELAARSFASDVSADGSVATGSALAGEGRPFHAFRWTLADGTADLHRAGWGGESIALAISGDGGVVVGTSTRRGRVGAFIWDEDRGMRALEQYLASFGLTTDGWALASAMDVSADGRTFIGSAYNLSTGEEASFIASVPAPGALGPLGALAFLAPRRRSRVR